MVGLIFIIISLILLVIAYKQYKKTKKLVTNGITTTAKIIAVHESQNTSTDEDGLHQPTQDMLLK